MKRLLVVALLAGCTKEADTDTTNAPPGAPVVSISPNPATTVDDLVASVDTPSDDPDGDAVTYTWSWTKNGAAVDGPTDSVPADLTTRGDVWAVSAVPSDGTEDGPAATAEITIDNAVPTLTIDLDPFKIGTNGRLVVSSDTDDADGDDVSVSFDWTVNGVAVSEQGHSLDGDVFFDKGDTVEVTVIADDGHGGTASQKASIVVGNEAPEAPVLAIEPDPAFDDDPLVCRVITPSTNADGDAVTYTITWKRNGTAYTEANRTYIDGDTVVPAATTLGDTWECTANPTDGTDAGDSATATATIVEWTGDRVFSPCGATGTAGPAQADCDAAYAGTTLAGEAIVFEGVQAWTAPFRGDYAISACGAQGASADVDHQGGRGACVSGTFTLAKGDTLRVAVGQVGTGSASGGSGGGGGGTFVIAAGDDPLLIAGGGGGTRVNADQDGCDGVAGEHGVPGSGESPSSACEPDTAVAGDGGAVSEETYGAGGGGFSSDGADDVYTSFDGTLLTFGYGGESWFNGLTGGAVGDECDARDGEGGFGGGGAGNGCWGGGGGGGYSGGGGGWVGGGGGSYNAAADATGTDGATSGDGSVTISYVKG